MTVHSGEIIGECKRSASGDSSTEEEILLRDGEETSREKRLLCGLCGYYITSRDRALEKSGIRVHVFTNPAGMTFRIGCFSSAPGCVTAGAPTEEYTWFPGYSWSFALCGSCMTHLGWFYESGSDGFYGLILANLAEEYLQ